MNVYSDEYEADMLGKVSCVDCGYSTTDELTIDVINDVTGVCPVCDSGALNWLTKAELADA